MDLNELDNVDKGILFLLQENPRTNTTADIGEKVGVSSSTVGNRINKLEERGIITGYHPTINYEKAGLDHHLLVIGTIPLEDQDATADDVMDVSGVVSVRELLSNNGNISIELVGRSRADIKSSISRLDAVGVEVERTEIMKTERVQTFDHFGQEYTTEDGTG